MRLDARQIAHAQGLSRAMLNALYARLDSRGVVSPAARDCKDGASSTGGPSASSVQQVVGSDVGDSDPTVLRFRALTWIGKQPALRQGKGLQVSDDDPTLRAGALRFLRGLDQKAWDDGVHAPPTDVTSGDVIDWRPYLSSSPALEPFGTAIESIFAEARPLGPHVFVARLSDNSWWTIRPFRSHTWVVPGIVLPDGFE